jgi:hypothetical protein
MTMMTLHFLKFFLDLTQQQFLLPSEPLKSAKLHGRLLTSKLACKIKIDFY